MSRDKGLDEVIQVYPLTLMWEMGRCGMGIMKHFSISKMNLNFRILTFTRILCWVN